MRMSRRRAVAAFAALLAAASILAGESRNAPVLPPVHRYRDMARCLDEFRDREFFECVYRQAYTDGTPHEKFVLGVLYENGLGVGRDLARAIRWYAEAAEDAAYPDIAVPARQALVRLNGDPSRALPASVPDTGTAEGDPAALLRQALRHLYGLCASLDYDLSRACEERAALAGDDEARLTVALSYSYGLNAYPRDAEAARAWAAPLSGSSAALAGAALGNGVTADPELDEEFFAGGRPLSEVARELYAEGRRSYLGDGGDTDYFTAGLRFCEAANFGVEEADNYHLLGLIQEEGLCGEPNAYGAGKNFRIAADLGDGRAMYRLGLLYEKGTGVRRSLSEAERLYASATAKGVAEAEGALERVRRMAAPGEPEDWESSEAFRNAAKTAEAWRLR